MELIGDEKRIQALFRELKLDDGCIAPRFNAVWNRARARGIRPRQAFKLSFAVIPVLVVCALFLLALWSRGWQRSQQSRALIATGESNSSERRTPTTVNPGPTQPVSVEPRRSFVSKSRTRKFAARRQVEQIAKNAAIRDAVAISNWQSPTTTLLRSPGDEVLTSLPQLDENAIELKSFLPNTPK